MTKKQDGRIYGWHFLYEGHKLRTGDKAPADGKWLEVKPPIVLCTRGLHASVHPMDALSHAPGPILCLVELGGVIKHDTDKLAAQRRKILARMDATEMLRYFARTQAMNVAHLWTPPDVVSDFLMTGDESIRAAARDAARAAAWAAAWAAARDAAWAAARDAAWAAAWAAARDAAWAAARRELNHLVCECFEGPLSLIDWTTQ